MEGRLESPLSMAVIASRRSGKTVFTKNLLLNQDRLILPPFKKVIWFYKFWQKQVFDELQNQSQFEIEFIDDLPNLEKMGKQVVNTCIIIDDLMVEASESKQVQALFTRGRHLNMSVIFLTQNLFHQGTHSRSMSLNTDYMVLFKNVRDKLQIKCLARQMYPSDTKYFLWAYEEAIKDAYGYLFLDLRPDADESLRIRSNILNEDYQTIYNPKNL